MKKLLITTGLLLLSSIGYTQDEETFSPEALNVISNWILKRI